MPGQTIEIVVCALLTRDLQWRAGQLPGQTRVRPARPDTGDPSMEGRAIARPNTATWSSRGMRSASFNGGPGNCPAKPDARGPAPQGCAAPSMEGRAIARPNVSKNGSGATLNMSPSMEGRAIARPNPDWLLYTDIAEAPSMEGRAIARPNIIVDITDAIRALTLQWRAGQLPGQTWASVGGGRGVCDLQWRAGQLPGQTARRRIAARSGLVTFNGGPGNCPAKPHRRPRTPMHGLSPSMEGRAIARPNASAVGTPAFVTSVLQWRAGQLPGQTCNSGGSSIDITLLLQWRAGQLPGQTSSRSP